MKELNQFVQWLFLIVSPAILVEKFMDREDVKNWLVENISYNVCCTEEEVVDSETLEDLEMDSLDSVELIMLIENDFNIEINELDEQEFKNLKTLDEMVDFIHNKLI